MGDWLDLSLDDLYLLAAVHSTSFIGRPRAIQILAVDLPITWVFGGFGSLLDAFWGAAWAEVAFVELFAEHILSLKQFSDECILGINHLHHFCCKSQMLEFWHGSVSILPLKLPKRRIPLNFFCPVAKHVLSCSLTNDYKELLK